MFLKQEWPEMYDFKDFFWLQVLIKFEICVVYVVIWNIKRKNFGKVWIATARCLREDVKKQLFFYLYKYTYIYFLKQERPEMYDFKDFCWLYGKIHFNISKNIRNNVKVLINFEICVFYVVIWNIKRKNVGKV